MTKTKEYQNKVFIAMEDRPRCKHRGCNESAQHTGRYRKDGTPTFRKVCSKHHNKKIAKKHGLNTLLEVVAAKKGMTVTEYQRNLLKSRAKKAGLTVTEYQRNLLNSRAEKAGLSVTDFTNLSHPYRKHRKEFCENRDGRLGFKCRYKIRTKAQLQVDHINGNPSDNRLMNLQTLCANCHCYKTHTNRDYQTPGRKAHKKKV